MVLGWCAPLRVSASSSFLGRFRCGGEALVACVLRANFVALLRARVRGSGQLISRTRLCAYACALAPAGAGARVRVRVFLSNLCAWLLALDTVVIRVCLHCCLCFIVAFGLVALQCSACPVCAIRFSGLRYLFPSTPLPSSVFGRMPLHVLVLFFLFHARRQVYLFWASFVFGYLA